MLPDEGRVVGVDPPILGEKSAGLVSRALLFPVYQHLRDDGLEEQRLLQRRGLRNNAVPLLVHALNIDK